MNKYFGIIIFVLFCLCLAITVLVTDPFFTSNLLDNTSPESAKGISYRVWDFFAYKSGVPEVFTPDEESHLHDVRNLLWVNGLLTVILGILLFQCIKTHGKEIAVKGFIALIIIVVLASVFPFENIFLWFHYVFFPQGNFLFPPGSMLLTVYPDSFFFYYSVGTAVCALASACFIFLLSRTTGHRSLRSL